MRRTSDAEKAGWRAGSGPRCPPRSGEFLHGRERLAWYRAKREGERVRALLADGDVLEERARGYLRGGR